MIIAGVVGFDGMLNSDGKLARTSGTLTADKLRIFNGGEIDLPAPAKALPVRHHLTVDPQTRDATIRKDPEAQV